MDAADMGILAPGQRQCEFQAVILLGILIDVQQYRGHGAFSKCRRIRLSKQRPLVVQQYYVSGIGGY
jgi:hypothetical protein